MGKRGPATKPTAMKVLEGNPGRRPLPAREPKPPIGVGPPPDDLLKLGKEHWLQYAPVLETQGVLTVLDRPAWLALCEAFALMERERVKLQHAPKLNTNKTRLSGAVILYRGLRDDYLKQCAKFGMTPSDRTGIVGDPPKGDDLEDFLFGPQAVK